MLLGRKTTTNKQTILLFNVDIINTTGDIATFHSEKAGIYFTAAHLYHDLVILG